MKKLFTYFAIIFSLLLLVSCYVSFESKLELNVIDHGTYCDDENYHVVGMDCGYKWISDIYYSLDGTNPTKNSKRYLENSYRTTSGGYSRGVLIPVNSDVVAIATMGGYENSKPYKLKISETVKKPTITDYGLYSSNSSYRVIGINCDTPNATIRYTTDGSDPTSYSTSYSSSRYYTTDNGYKYGVLVPVGSTVKAMATKSGYLNSYVETYSMPISNPKITKCGSYYYSSSYKVVKIECDTPDVIIRYTTNGNDPTSSSEVYSPQYYNTSYYSGSYGILVRSGDTVKAIATKDGYTSSDVVSLYVY